jgi:hypothetical protein
MATIDVMAAEDGGDRAHVILTARIQALHAAIKWSQSRNSGITASMIAKAGEFERWLLRDA